MEMELSRGRSFAIVLALGFGQLVAYASSFYLLGVLADAIAHGVGVAPTLVFTLLSGAFLLSAFIGPLVGKWLQARGGREVLLASSVVFAAALGLIGAANGVAVLAAGVLMLGAGMGVGLYGTPNAILVELHGERARPWITAVALMGGLGSSTGFLVTGWLLREAGWRGACFAWAGVHLAICLPLALLLVPRSHSHAATKTAAPPIRVAWDRRMVQLAVLFAGSWFVSTCMSAHLPRLLHALGLTVAQAESTAAFLGLAAVSARAVELIVLRRMPPLSTTRIATLLSPLGALVALSFGPQASVALVIGQGLGNGMLSVASGVLPLAVFGREGYALRSALITTPARFVQAAGPGLFALALAASPQAALGLSSGVCLMMFAMTFGLASRTSLPFMGRDGDPGPGPGEARVGMSEAST
jgi:cyanate permease